jgi:geranylgeranyl reductase family protein
MDTIVVGAGPAGSVAALVLARAGAKVHLIDRASFPRDKLCGDTLNPGSLAILDGHGSLGHDIRARSLPIRGMTVTGPGGALVTADYPDDLRGAALMRRDLDSILLDAAIAAGAQFSDGVAVRGAPYREAGSHVIGVRVATSRGEEDWPARVVIAADGRHSTLAFALGLTRYAPAPRRWAFGAYFADVDGVGRHGEMHIRPDGYIGVAPLPGGITNLCVVREWRTRPAASDRKNAEQTIATAIAADPVLRDRFARARQVSDITTLGPLAVEAHDAGCPGLLLAGDAAGFIDPMTGDGLRFALRGGELAAAAALRELSSGAPAFQHLRNARAREFAGKWRVNRVLRSLVASPRGVDLAASVAARWPAPVRLLIGIAGDVHLARNSGLARKCGGDLHGPPREP